MANMFHMAARSGGYGKGILMTTREKRSCAETDALTAKNFVYSK
jgi:hypothetical protein